MFTLLMSTTVILIPFFMPTNVMLVSFAKPKVYAKSSHVSCVTDKISSHVSYFVHAGML